MNNKKLLHYTFAATMLTGLLLGGTYSYLSLSIQNAYNNKEYGHVAKLTERYKSIFPNSYQIALKASLEERLESDLKGSGKTIIDPRLDFLPFNLEDYMSRESIDNSSEKWAQFYKELEKHTSLNDFINSSQLNNRPIIKFYPVLATKASQLNFNNREYYLNSCYNFNLAVAVSEITYTIDKYVNDNDKLGFSNADLKKWSTLELKNINKTIKALNSIKNKHISKEYYKEMEIIFYETITTIYQLSNELQHHDEKETLNAMNKSLFSNMKIYSSDRDSSFPRSDKEIKQYQLLESLFKPY